MQLYDRTQKIVLTGLMTALITVSTMVIAFPVPFTNGYIHLGDSMIFLAVLILGWKYGAFAAGVGSALADIFLSYVHWAPWTFVIKALMAVVMGLIIQQCMKDKRFTALFSLVIGAVWLAFNFGVKKIVAMEAAANAERLFEDAGVSSVTELGEFINNVQSQLMIIALAIPVVLALISIVVRKKENIFIPLYQVLAMTATGLWMVFGYYIAGGILYGNFAVSAFSIPANMLQFIGGFLIAVLVAGGLMKTPARKFFTYKSMESR